MKGVILLRWMLTIWLIMLVWRETGAVSALVIFLITLAIEGICFLLDLIRQRLDFIDKELMRIKSLER